MPRSKNPDNYPKAYGELLRLAYRQDDEVRVPAENVKAARNLQNSIYAYINAVDAQEKADGIQYELRLAPQYRQVKLSVEKLDGQVSLVLQNKNAAPELQGINAVLAAQKQEQSAPLPSPYERQPEEHPDADERDEHAEVVGNLFGRET